MVRHGRVRKKHNPRPLCTEHLRSSRADRRPLQSGAGAALGGEPVSCHAAAGMITEASMFATCESRLLPLEQAPLGTFELFVGENAGLLQRP